jgi:hypothetical protein
VVGRFSIEAAQVVGPRQEAPVIALAQGRTDPEALAAPCIPPGLSPAEHPVPAEGPVSVPLARASALVLDLVPRALESGAQVV